VTKTRMEWPGADGRVARAALPASTVAQDCALPSNRNQAKAAWIRRMAVGLVVSVSRDPVNWINLRDHRQT